MIKSNNEWNLPIKGFEVAQIRVDYAFGLLLWTQANEASLLIECVFTFCDSNSSAWTLEPDGPRPSLAPALALFGQKVERADVQENWRLDLVFSDGSALSVEPDPSNEAWSLCGPQNFKAVSMPGGVLAIWSSE